jgi:hypothetical protein
LAHAIHLALKHAGENSGLQRIRFFCKKLTRVDFASVLFRLDKSIRYVKNHKEVQQRFADAQRVAKPRTLIAIGGLQRWYVSIKR